MEKPTEKTPLIQENNNHRLEVSQNDARQVSDDKDDYDSQEQASSSGEADDHDVGHVANDHDVDHVANDHDVGHVANNHDVAKYALLDAFHHEPSAPGLKNKKRLLIRATRHSVFCKVLFIGAACLLLFFVPLLEQKHSFTKSANYSIRKEESVATKSAFLWSSTALESVLLLVLLLDIVLKGIALFPFYEKITSDWVPKSKKPNIVKQYIYHNRFFAHYRLISFYAYIICWVASFICIIGTCKTRDTNWFITTRQLIRPVFLIVQVTMLKKALRAIFAVSWRQLFVLALFALLFIVVFIFMMIGFGVFPPDLHPSHHKHYTADPDTVSEGDNYFNSSAEAYWNLIVYLSTANSPDIATPAYAHNRFYFLYFGIFYFIGNVLILKVLAVFYAINFNSLLKDSMERTYRHRKSSLHWAFENMKEGNEKVSKKDLKNFITNYNITDEKTFDELWKNLNLELDEIDCNNFKKLIFNIFHKSQEKPSKQEHRTTAEDEGQRQRNTNGLMCLSFFTNVLGYFPFLVAVSQFFALTVLVIKDYNDTLTDPHSIMARTMVGFLIVLGLEIIIKFFLHCKLCRKLCCKQDQSPNVAPKDEKRNEKNQCEKCLNWFFCGHSLRGKKEAIKVLLIIVDWLLLIAVFGLGLVHPLCLKGGNYDDCLNLADLIGTIQATICCIALRMMRMLAEIPVFSILFKYMIRILFLFIPFLLLGYLFYYEFAVIGMAIFRGVNLTDTEAAAECGSYEHLKYHPYNFEDFGSTLVLLWNLMIVNNWHVMVDAYVRRTSVYSRIYFVVWWLVSETIINGVIFGLLIEILTNAKGGLENTIVKFNKKLKEKTCKLDKLSLFLGLYVFSGEKRTILLQANSYSFCDIIKIVFCKIKPESNKSSTNDFQPVKIVRYSTYISYNDIDDDVEETPVNKEPVDEIQDLPWNIFDTMEYEKGKLLGSNR